MYAVVSTLDDARGSFVRAFDTKQEAERWAVEYAKKDGRSGDQITAETDTKWLDDFRDFLIATEWFFVAPLEYVVTEDMTS